METLIADVSVIAADGRVGLALRKPGAVEFEAILWLPDHAEQIATALLAGVEAYRREHAS